MTGRNKEPNNILPADRKKKSLSQYYTNEAKLGGVVHGNEQQPACHLHEIFVP